MFSIICSSNSQYLIAFSKGDQITTNVLITGLLFKSDTNLQYYKNNYKCQEASFHKIKYFKNTKDYYICRVSAPGGTIRSEASFLVSESNYVHFPLLVFLNYSNYNESSCISVFSSLISFSFLVDRCNLIFIHLNVSVFSMVLG